MDVSILTYHDNKFFLHILEQEGIRYQNIRYMSRPERALEIRNILRKGNQDVVLAFLPGPSVYAELASLPSRKWGLVVSERTAVPNSHKRIFPWKRILHSLADYVCTNSHTNRLMIEHSVPQLSGRVVTIYNAVDLENFHPRKKYSDKTDRIIIAVVASHQVKKNLKGLIRAMSIVRRIRPDIRLEIHWYGDIHPDSSPFDEGVEMIMRNGLTEYMHLFPASKSIAAVYNSSDAVALVSFYEGLPNVVCEAMACGRPILMSNVCDAENLVLEGENGFLFDPHSADEISKSLIKFCDLSIETRYAMGSKSRQMAEYMFDPERVAAKYLRILEAAARRKSILPDHWVPEVPNSAFRTIG